jgi:tripartite-type tricarboxylate transporter receptor subunit TctC
MTTTRLPRRALLAAAPLLGLSAPAIAQLGAERPLRVVVPFAPGTPPDVLSRIVANALGETEGWRVVVENRPGAIGALGAAEVLRQPADGNTLMAATLPMSAAAALMPDQRHDLVRDFKGVARISRSYNVLVVHPSVPAASTPELVALLRQRPDALNFSSPGYGTPAHLIGEMFLLRTDTRATHVPYNAFPQMIADLLTGTNQFMFVTTVPVLEHIASGRLRALAVTAPARLPSLPDIATTAEQGLPDIVMEDWVGFLARSGTPEAVVARLGAAVERVLASPATQAQIRRLGVEPATMTPDAFTRFVSADVALWGGVVRDRGIRIPR